MAKRKRLGPATLTGEASALPSSPATPSLETKSLRFGGRAGGPPIAQVAGASAAEAALTELSDEVAAARAEGRLVQTLPLDAIEAAHLKRDRMVSDPEEMAALKASIAARGQQMPIDVVELERGRFGLISGWRRLQALRALHAETGEDRYAAIRAVLRRPASAAEAYLSMIEENELRTGLSYYERAQVAARAAEDDVFDGSHAAIAALFPTASKAKRSKIASFVRVYEGLDDTLRFPWEIGERLGLRLAQALADGQGAALRAALRAADAQDAAAEAKALSDALAGAATGAGQGADDRDSVADAPATFPGGVALSPVRGGLKLTGPGVDATLRRDLEAWLEMRGAGAGTRAAPTD